MRSKQPEAKNGKRREDSLLRIDYFRKPPAEFRPLPFWGLNDALEDRELRHQIKEMKRKGWGGFFIHPRYGMETPYLTSEYMNRIKTCVDEARRQGLEVWIYDEHPFPAGCAGGLVGAERNEYRHKALVLRSHSRLTPIEEGVAYFAAKLDKGLPTELKQVRKPERFHGTADIFFHFYEWTYPVSPSSHQGITNDFIHGFPYTDTLSPKAVRRFIDLTYEGYRRSIGREFGKTVKGAFSDIPVYQWHYATPRPSIPWTTDLPSYFRERCGYDLIPHLPSLFFDVGDYARIRHDFWEVVNQRFLESYTKQLYQWCARHKLQYTAHYWGEEMLHWQIPWTGDVMTHFANQHVVSIDHILRNIEDPVGVKQAASVAEQLGKPRLISETYALSGHNLTYEERKWIGDWEYALGVNFIVPYIPAYSMRGRRKRDEPPSEFLQQPYWHYESLLNDYYGRLSYLLSQGRRVVEMLVLQPLASARTLYKPGAESPAAYRPHPDPFEAAGVTLYQFSQKFSNLCEQLLRLHRDFHLGNEALLADQAKVEGDRLRVGEMSYSVVLVPPSLNLFQTTIDLLETFCAQGGKVIAVTPLPTMIEGRRKGHILPSSVTVIDDSAEELSRALGRVLPADLEIEGGEEILYQHRQVGASDLYFLANTSLEKTYLNTRVRILGEGSIELWDAFTGRRYELHAEPSEGGLTLGLDFFPVSSYLFVRHSQKKENLPVFPSLPHRFDRVVPLSCAWDFDRLDPNALTLDYCEVNIEETGWTGRLPVWQAHQRIRRAGVGARFVIRYCFDVVERPSALFLALEDPKRYRVSLNGEVLPRKDSGAWWDPSIRLFDIRALARVGENVVEFAGAAGIDTEIENCYVVGDFGLEQNDGFRIVKEPSQVRGENLVREGYPFFTGRLILKREVELREVSGRVYLRLDRLDAIVAQIRVNDVQAGILAWKPYLLEITEHLRPGKNRLEIELCTSLHNLLGPHHNKQGETRHFVLQHSWTDVVNWTDDYFFVPVGLTGAAIVATND
jgi:alpha-L-rhamnosidase